MAVIGIRKLEFARYSKYIDQIPFSLELDCGVGDLFIPQPPDFSGKIGTSYGIPSQSQDDSQTNTLIPYIFSSDTLAVPS